MKRQKYISLSEDTPPLSWLFYKELLSLINLKPEKSSMHPLVNTLIEKSAPNDYTNPIKSGSSRNKIKIVCMAPKNNRKLPTFDGSDTKLSNTSKRDFLKLNIASKKVNQKYKIIYKEVDFNKLKTIKKLDNTNKQSNDHQTIKIDDKVNYALEKNKQNEISLKNEVQGKNKKNNISIFGVSHIHSGSLNNQNALNSSELQYMEPAVVKYQEKCSNTAIDLDIKETFEIPEDEDSLIINIFSNKHIPTNCIDFKNVYGVNMSSTYQKLNAVLKIESQLSKELKVLKENMSECKEYSNQYTTIEELKKQENNLRNEICKNQKILDDLNKERSKIEIEYVTVKEKLDQIEDKCSNYKNVLGKTLNLQKEMGELKKQFDWLQSYLIEKSTVDKAIQSEIDLEQCKKVFYFLRKKPNSHMSFHCNSNGDQ